MVTISSGGGGRGGCLIVLVCTPATVCVVNSPSRPNLNMRLKAACGSAQHYGSPDGVNRHGNSLHSCCNLDGDV
jgi:hypothetical protein